MSAEVSGRGPGGGEPGSDTAPAAPACHAEAAGGCRRLPGALDGLLVTDPGPPADDPWGDPIGPLTLEWAAPDVEPPPPLYGASPAAVPRAPGAAEGVDRWPGDAPRIDPTPAPSRRIRYAAGPARRTKSLVELLFVAAILAAVLAALLGAGIAGLVGIVHRTVRND